MANTMTSVKFLILLVYDIVYLSGNSNIGQLRIELKIGPFSIQQLQGYVDLFREGVTGV